jgi:hypothetical protein
MWLASCSALQQNCWSVIAVWMASASLPAVKERVPKNLGELFSTMCGDHCATEADEHRRRAGRQEIGQRVRRFANAVSTRATNTPPPEERRR